MLNDVVEVPYGPTEPFVVFDRPKMQVCALVSVNQP